MVEIWFSFQQMSNRFTDFSIRQLVITEPKDKKIIRRLFEKTLEISIKSVTGKRMMHGIFLLEDPIPLYRCEKAKLYIGFSVCVNVNQNEAIIELTPKAYRVFLAKECGMVEKVFTKFPIYASKYFFM